jgi:hypothetical protein
MLLLAKERRWFDDGVFSHSTIELSKVPAQLSLLKKIVDRSSTDKITTDAASFPLTDRVFHSDGSVH